MTMIHPRTVAREEGRTTYNTGKPCIRGHFSDRTTVDGTCVECHRLLRLDRKPSMLFDWNENAVERLRNLAPSLSASAIAVELGTTSNSVIGKCHRLHIKLSGSPGPRPQGAVSPCRASRPYRPRPVALVDKPRVVLAKQQPPPIPRGSKPTGSNPRIKPVDLEPKQPPLTDRMGVGPAVAALTQDQCCYPLGAVDSDQFHFCAAPVDMRRTPRYCDKHTALALNPRATRSV